MKVVPVLDLLGGVVVRGIAGRRSEYQPIESRHSIDASPAGVACGLSSAFGFDACYIADLDAIAGAEPDLAAYGAIAATGMRLWVDAGTGTASKVACLSDQLGVGGRVVVGLESLTDNAEPEDIAAAVDPSRLIFSLDLKHGRPLLADASPWCDRSPEEIAAAVVATGFRALIVLELSAVGVGQGVPTLPLCRRLHTEYPQLEIITGGGVRGTADLDAIREAGCDAALVASALHDGRIGEEMIKAE